MSIHFCYTTGEHLPARQGLPKKYQGMVLKGAKASHISAPFGEIVCQEFNTQYVGLRKLHINWRQPEGIVCRHDNPTGMFSRVSLNNRLHEYIKGAGLIHLKKEQFSILSGNTWTSLLLVQKPGEYHFIDLTWSAAFLQRITNETYPFDQPVRNAYRGFPKREIGPISFLNESMSLALFELEALDFSRERASSLLHEKLGSYFRTMMDVSKKYDAATREMKEFDWVLIHEVKKLIDSNLETQFTTAEISMQTGMNEFKLKKLFPKVTGFKMEEYRKYQLCVKAGGQVVKMPDVPLKSLYEITGYSTLQNFIRAFQKYCACTPGELRLNTWEVNNFSPPIETEP
ncbi:MAG: AraC family transcriptional regulator [Flavitalea sp.]